MNKLLNIYNTQNLKNYIAIDFDTIEKAKSKLNFKDDTIKSCGEILADYLIKYIKNGGDINNLTPQKVFRKNI